MTHVSVALTFAGGPDGVSAGRRSATAMILDVLKNPAASGVATEKDKPIVAAFFVQTHVPNRMADAAGKLGPNPAAFSAGQRLVRRMVDDKHLIMLLNGSKTDMELHIDQKALEDNLKSGLAALKVVTGAEPSTRIRSPAGVHDEACDKVYRTLGLTHVHWTTVDADFIPTDLCPGQSIERQGAFFARFVKQAADTIRRQLRKPKAPNAPPPPPPPPQHVVVQLHDISVTTGAHLPKLLQAILAAGKIGGVEIPIRFCTSAEELTACLEKESGEKRGTFRALQAARKQKYAIGPHLLESYGNEMQTFLAWMLIQGEGWVPHLYLDSISEITAGVGSRIPTADAAAGLTLMKGSTPRDPEEAADEPEKRKAWDNLNLVRMPPRLVPTKQRVRLDISLAATEVHLTDGETRKLLITTRDTFERELDHIVHTKTEKRLATLPRQAQLALADMMFNVGGPSLAKFPSMFTAIKNSQWAIAAEQSQRRIKGAPTPPGLAERNRVAADLFTAIPLEALPK